MKKKKSFKVRTVSPHLIYGDCGDCGSLLLVWNPERLRPARWPATQKVRYLLYNSAMISHAAAQGLPDQRVQTSSLDTSATPDQPS